MRGSRRVRDSDVGRTFNPHARGGEVNNAEFAKEARARQQWADEMPEDLESLLAAWASVDLDLTEALRRLEQDEKRIEELETELERLKPKRVEAARITIEED